MPVERRFTIQVERDDATGWFVGEVLELPGCYTQAPDMSSLHANVYEAMIAYLNATEPDAKMPANFVEVWQGSVPV